MLNTNEKEEQNLKEKRLEDEERLKEQRLEEQMMEEQRVEEQRVEEHGADEVCGALQVSMVTDIHHLRIWWFFSFTVGSAKISLHVCVTKREG